MTRDQTKAAAQVMLAWAEGKVIQFRARGPGNSWMCGISCEDEEFFWNWERNDYRLKPEPREFWVFPDLATWRCTEVKGNDNPARGWIKVREVLE